MQCARHAVRSTPEQQPRISSIPAVDIKQMAELGVTARTAAYHRNMPTSSPPAPLHEQPACLVWSIQGPRLATPRTSWHGIATSSANGIADTLSCCCCAVSAFARAGLVVAAHDGAMTMTLPPRRAQPARDTLLSLVFTFQRGG